MEADYLKFILDTPIEDDRPFGAVAQDWQIQDYRGMLTHLYSMLIRSRGSDKTAGAARYARAKLILSKQKQNIYAVATDGDQVLILKEDVDRMNDDDPATGALCKSTKDEILLKYSPRSRIKFLTHDAPSAYGLRPTLILCDEMAEWRKKDLWTALYTASGKVPGCQVIVISVPPPVGVGFFSDLMETAKRDPRWYFSHRTGPAPWAPPAWVQTMKDTNDPHVYLRLIEGIPTEGAGAVLLLEEVEAWWQPMPAFGSGPVAVGCDIGYAGDSTYISLVEKHPTGLYCVRHLIGWTPRAGQRVDLIDVETELETAAKQYNASVYLDPFQGVLLAQRLQRRGVHVVEYSFAGDGRKKLFGTFLDIVRRKQLRCQYHADLRAELLGLEVRESVSGYRVDHKVGGNDDAVMSITLALQGLPQTPHGPLEVWAGGRRVAYLGAEQSADEHQPWSSRGSQGVPDKWGDW